MAALVQVAGSLVILAAFAAERRGRLTTDSTAYLTLNLRRVVCPRRARRTRATPGFLLLEISWATVSGVSLASGVRRRRSRRGRR